MNSHGLKPPDHCIHAPQEKYGLLVIKNWFQPVVDRPHASVPQAGLFDAPTFGHTDAEIFPCALLAPVCQTTRIGNKSFLWQRNKPASFHSYGNNGLEP